MSHSDTHIAPSAYAMEKAVRVATRRLGSSATPASVEVEALGILAAEGYAVSAGPASGATRTHFLSDEAFAGHQVHVSVSAAPCASRRMNTQRAHLYDRLRKVALSIPETERAHAVLHVRDTSSLLTGHDASSAVVVAETLSEVANDTGIHAIHGPFLDLALAENLYLLEALPEILAVSALLCPTVQIGTTDNGHPEASLEALSYAIATRLAGGAKGHPLIISDNDCDRRAFGHRVHSENIVWHRHVPPDAPESSHRLTHLPETWNQVMAADLPVFVGAPPVRMSDHIMDLAGSSSPVDIFDAIARTLLSAPSSGARRQLLLMC